MVLGYGSCEKLVQTPHGDTRPSPGPPLLPPWGHCLYLLPSPGNLQCMCSFHRRRQWQNPNPEPGSDSEKRALALVLRGAQILEGLPSEQGDRGPLSIIFRSKANTDCFKLRSRDGGSRLRNAEDGVPLLPPPAWVIASPTEHRFSAAHKSCTPAAVLYRPTAAGS